MSKSTLSVPIHYRPSHLPPSPPTISSSTSSIHEESTQRASNRYGSLSNTPFPEQQTTTTSPNEGLYLVWTQQLLRERGFTPSPIHGDLMTKRDISDDDNSSVSEASLSSDDDDYIDRSVAEQRNLAKSDSNIKHDEEQPSFITLFFRSCSCL